MCGKTAETRRNKIGTITIALAKELCTSNYITPLEK